MRVTPALEDAPASRPRLMQSNTAAEPRLQGRMAALTLQMTVPAHDGDQPR